MKNGEASGLAVFVFTHGGALRARDTGEERMPRGLLLRAQ